METCVAQMTGACEGEDGNAVINLRDETKTELSLEMCASGKPFHL